MTLKNDNELRENKDPLHGVTLKMMIMHLQVFFGWEELGRRIKIKCFNNDPSVTSSLIFLRKTPWARKKVEKLYLNSLHQKRKTRT